MLAFRFSFFFHADSVSQLTDKYFLPSFMNISHRKTGRTTDSSNGNVPSETPSCSLLSKIKEHVGISDVILLVVMSG